MYYTLCEIFYVAVYLYSESIEKGRMNMPKVRVDIVCFGLMGQLHADALYDNPWTELKVVADIKNDRR
jgi:hypothetical protein